MPDSRLTRIGNRIGLQSTAGGRGLVVNPYRVATIRQLGRGVGGQARRVVRAGLGSASVLAPLAAKITDQQVAADKLLLGNQAGHTGAEYALAVDDLFWTSTPVDSGPHADLLRRAISSGVADAVGPGFADTQYGQLGARCLELKGNFFGHTTMEGVAEHARAFAESHLSGSKIPVDYHGGSDAGSAIRVRPIEHSDCFQLLDGHHRAARAVVGGATHVRVSLRGTPVSTALQDYLNSMTWIGGKREIYQPLPAPELVSEWPLVRRSNDRLARIGPLLEHIGVDPGASYLDVGACYGWFVASMRDAGYDAFGLEIDPLAPPLAQAAYGLDPSRITTGEASAFLREATDRWDVVSSFSVLHHFVLGRGGCGPEEFVRLLDQVTNRVLFIDTGQCDERWFRQSLAGWTPDYVREFMLEHTTFKDVIDLGPDQDRVVPYQHNYGRHLFACVR